MPLMRDFSCSGLSGGLLLAALLSRWSGAQFQSLALSGATRFACGLTSAGRLYCWGNNEHGQLGIGKVGEHRTSPVPVALTGPLEAVTLGIDYACALQRGRPFCWGINARGELADSSHVYQRAVPRPVKGTLRFRTLCTTRSLRALT